MAKALTRDELSQAGAQYGHQTKRWNPKMAPYIYGVKNKTHIIDLQKTLAQLALANELMQQVAKKNEKVLFVGTKRNGKLAVKEAALRTGNHYVNERWLGGTLTNMRTISSRIKALWEIEKEEANGRLVLRTKKEQILILKEKASLEKTLGGIKQMRKLPSALVVVDPKGDEIAVKEARKLKIPVIGICDTNVDPDIVDIAIPANDDVMESINIIINNLVDNYAEAANLTLVPSALKVVAPKKAPLEDGERQGYRGRNNRYNMNNNNYQNYQHQHQNQATPAPQVDSEKPTTKEGTQA